MKSLLSLAAVPLLISVLHADTIRLRDGRELEGVVMSEEGDDYVVMVQVTKTIRDQRRIPKKDVLEIVGEKKDETAYEDLEDLVPAPDGLEVSDYDARISKLEDFAKEFPESSLIRKVEPMMKTLEEEREIVAAGGVKFEGKMLSAEERTSAAFTLDSRIVAAEMEDAIESGRRTDALRAWDRLQKEFPTSRAYRDSIPAIQKVMQRQLAAVNKELDTLDRRLEEQATNLERVPVKDRARAREAIEARATAYLRKVAQEEEAGERWISLDPFQKTQLSKVKSLLESELRRLENLDTLQLPDGDAAWSEAWATLSGSPSDEEAREAFSSAREARLPEKYLDMLEAKMPSK